MQLLCVWCWSVQWPLFMDSLLFMNTHSSALLGDRCGAYGWNHEPPDVSQLALQPSLI